MPQPEPEQAPPPAAPEVRVGLWVLYCFDASFGRQVERPAQVVRVWTPGDHDTALQLVVSIDGQNDYRYLQARERGSSDGRQTTHVWRTGVERSESGEPESGRWRLAR